MYQVFRAKKTYQYVREKMKKVGYGLTEKILDASYCGVPQKRKRLFLIGCLGAEDDFLLDYLNKNLLLLREYIRRFGRFVGGRVLLPYTKKL